MPDRSPPLDLAADSPAIPHWYSPDGTPLSIERGDGATVYDADDNAYLDFLSQLYSVNAGHSCESIIAAIEAQLRAIPYVSPAQATDTRTRLAAKLRQIAPGGLSEVFFSISGSEANESAIQIARAYQDAPKILTRWRSYHGGTYGAGALTGDPVTRTTVERYAATTGVAKFLPPLPHRAPFPAETPEELAEQAGDHLEFVIRNEGADSIAAILTEPVGGTSGAYPAPPGYFERVRELCDTYDILLIADEVISGFGRCGDWFAIDAEGIEPDMITFAKGLTSSYVPLGGVIVSEEIGAHLRSNGIALGQTFAGHPVACAAGLAAIEAYEDGLIDNVRALAPALEDGLRAVERAHAAVGSVHGRGFLWSVEFTDPATDRPFHDPWVDEGDNPVQSVRACAKEAGVLFGTGRPDLQLIVAPPFCVTEAEIERALDVLDRSISSVFD